MTLNDFINSDYYQGFEYDFWCTNTFLNYSDKRINEIMEARENGCCGLTHSEVIDLERAAVDCAWKDDEITEAQMERFVKELDKIEEWHFQNGSLEQET